MTDADSVPEKEQAGDDFDAAFDKAWQETERTDDADPTESKPEVQADPQVKTDKPAENTDDADGKADSAKADAPSDKPAGPEGDKPEAAPSDWSQAEREAYGRLPKQAQTQVMRLYKSFQAGFTRKSQETSEKVKVADELSRIAEPYRAELKAAGMSPHQAFERLAEINRFSKSNPVGYVQWFMQQAGLKPDQLGFTTQIKGLEAETYQDPALAKLEERLTGFERQQQEQQRAAEARLHQSIQSEIAAFRDKKNDAGELAHPHYERLKQHIASILRDDPKATLDGAYQEALYRDADLRRERIKAETDQALAEERRKAQEAADKAKMAGRNIQGSPGAKGGARKVKDFDDAFAEAEKKLGATWS